MEKLALQRNIVFKIACTNQDFTDGQTLFQQYANSLDVDLCFQDFPNELKTIDKQYNKPGGALVIAFHDTSAVGCVGIRKYDNDTAELKRMFVQPEYRGHHLGQQLLEFTLSVARELNYKKIRLDTLPTMKQAQQLYRSFGFYEISPYRFNPVNGTVFMEKEL
ncbi:MAG: GNAT family N-acetyltransferase [Bacteroidetes bacterium]|nr:MAG: GNAT family N-acetyltransferase [Bacteroidota bacterium]